MFPWGKIIAATADEIADFGPSASRIKALLRMVPTLSDDAIRTVDNARAFAHPSNSVIVAAQDLSKMRNPNVLKNIENAIWNMDFPDTDINANFMFGAEDAALAEAAGDNLARWARRSLSNPLAAGRALDIRRQASPESFTSIARGLGERGLVTAPRDVRVAQRLSMADPTYTQLVMSFVDDGMSLEDAMAAARALGV
jgi:hypothetical protein